MINKNDKLKIFMYNQNNKYYSVEEFENDVLAVEGFHIYVINTNQKALRYEYKKQFPGRLEFKDFLKRISLHVEGDVLTYPCITKINDLRQKCQSIKISPGYNPNIRLNQLFIYTRNHRVYDMLELSKAVHEYNAKHKDEILMQGDSITGKIDISEDMGLRPSFQIRATADRLYKADKSHPKVSIETTFQAYNIHNEKIEQEADRLKEAMEQFTKKKRSRKRK